MHVKEILKTVVIEFNAVEVEALVELLGNLPSPEHNDEEPTAHSKALDGIYYNLHGLKL